MPKSPLSLNENRNFFDKLRDRLRLSLFACAGWKLRPPGASDFSGEGKSVSPPFPAADLFLTYRSFLGKPVL